jgi:twitching motility protein PilT
VKAFVRQISEGSAGSATGTSADLTEHGAVDVAMDGREAFGPVRVHAFAELSGTRLAIRLLAEHIPAFDDLGLPKELVEISERLSGLVIFVGPTNSGKTTAQVSLLQRIADLCRVHIMTLEDPIEYRLRGKRAIVSQLEVGAAGHVRDHRVGLRDILRSDPDVLMLQEARTPEAMHAGIELAEQGRMVFTSVHARDASSAPDRIIGSFPGDIQPQVRQQLANSLSAIIVLRLVPLKDGTGRVPAFELLIATDAIRNYIRDGESEQLRNQITAGRGSGMITLERSLAQLVSSKLIDLTVAERIAIRPTELRRDLNELPLAASSDGTPAPQRRRTAFG